MSTELAKAYVQIVPSAEGISGSIGKVLNPEATKAGGDAGKSIGGNLVSTLKGVLVAAGIGTIIKDAFNEGAALQQSLGGVETLFGDAANMVVQNSQQAFRTAGLSANEYMETVTGFSAALLQGVGGDSVKAATAADIAIKDMSDNANKFGSDMSSIQNAYAGFAKQNYTMLDNLKLGYGGTKSEMERLLKDAQAISGVKYDINNLADVYEAIHVIQTEVGITGTTAAESATTFSGSMASMQAATQNLLGALTMGGDVAGAFTALGETLFTFVENNVIPMLGNLLLALPDVITGATTLIATGLNDFATNAPELVSFAINLITTLTDSLLTNLPVLIAALVQVAAALGTALLEYDWFSIASGVIDWIVNGLNNDLPKMIEEGGTIVNSLIEKFMQSYPEFMTKGAELLGKLADGIIQALPQIIQSAVTIINQLITTIMQNLPQILQTGVELLLKLVEGIIASLPDLIVAAVEAIVSFVTTIAENLPQILESGISLLGEFIAGIISMLPDLLAGIGDIITGIIDAFKNTDWLEIGKNIILGIKDGVVAFASKLWDSVKEVVEDVVDGVKDLLGIESPSRVFANEVGRYIPAGIAKGIEDNQDLVTDAMEEVTGSTISTAIAGATSMGAPRTNGIYLTNPIYLDGQVIATVVNERLGVLV